MRAQVARMSGTQLPQWGFLALNNITLQVESLGRLCKVEHIRRKSSGAADGAFHAEWFQRRMVSAGQGEACGGWSAARIDDFSRGGIEWQVNCGTPAYVELLCRLVARKAMPPRNLAAATSHGRLNFMLAVPLASGTRIPTPGRQLLANAAEARISWAVALRRRPGCRPFATKASAVTPSGMPSPS